jgi:hypothetical protein
MGTSTSWTATSVMAVAEIFVPARLAALALALASAAGCVDSRDNDDTGYADVNVLVDANLVNSDAGLGRDGGLWCGPAVAPGADEVRCGPHPCSGDSPVCCLLRQEEGATGTCFDFECAESVAAAAGCISIWACDERADCPGDRLCCTSERRTDAGLGRERSCRPASDTECQGSPCDSDADCLAPIPYCVVVVSPDGDQGYCRSERS